MALPSFSVVIPTYNRPQQLDRCLAALAKQDYPQDSYRVVVVDDGSRQPLHDIVNAYTDQMTVTLIVQENAGPAAARNKGVQNATGDYIAFTDDDCMPDAHWLREFAKTLQSHPDAMVGGHTINALPQNIPSFG